METAQEAAPAPETSQGGEVGQATGSPPPDAVIVHPFLHPLASMLPDSMDFSEEMEAYMAPNSRKQARRGLRLLTQARLELGTELASATSSPSALAQSRAQTRYLSLLLGLLGQVDVESARGPDPDSPLRHAATYAWRGGVHPQHRSRDAMFELLAVLVAGAICQARSAAAACADSATGVNTQAATQAYRQLLAAAGQVETASAALLPHLPADDPSVATQGAVLAALTQHCLAEAQYLTTLRAVAKGSSVNLIAGLALEAAALYAGVEAALASAPGASPKLVLHARYKAAAMHALGLSFAALVLWRAGGGGAPSASSQALAEWANARAAATAYDAAEPRSLNLDHRRSDEVLQNILEDTARRVGSGSGAGPGAAPALPQGKRLVSAAPFAFPAPDVAFGGEVAGWMRGEAGTGGAAAGAAAGGGGTLGMTLPGTATVSSASAVGAGKTGGPALPVISTEAAEASSPSCGRWLLFCLAAPLFVIISALGILIWILLLPVKLLCLPCGCAAQLAANVVEGLIKLPLRGMLWAAGKPYHSGEGPKGAVTARH